MQMYQMWLLPLEGKMASFNISSNKFVLKVYANVWVSFCNWTNTGQKEYFTNMQYQL